MILDCRAWTAKDLIASRRKRERTERLRCERQVNKDTAREIKSLPVTKRKGVTKVAPFLFQYDNSDTYSKPNRMVQISFILYLGKLNLYRFVLIIFSNIFDN